MSLRGKLVLVAAIVASSPLGARAAKLDKDAKKWLDEVRPIMLPEEEKTFRDLNDKADRDEFQKIFWARRDPNLETPENESKIAYDKARAEADAQFKVGGQVGSLTDCGRVYLLLGKPDDLKKEPGADAAVLRGPETWTYRDRPGMTFQGGEVKIGFEANCQLPQGARLGEQLNRLAASRIVQPNLGYKKDSAGHLVKLADQLPKPSPSQTLLKTPRQDFPAAAEAPLMLRTEDGATYVAGLLRGDASGLTVHDAAGKKTVKVVVAAQAVDATGKVAANTQERTVNADVSPKDNTFLVSFGVALRPGDYTLKAAALDPQSGKGSAVTLPLKAPDFQAGDLVMSPLAILEDFLESTAPKDPADPLADFAMTGARLVPRFGNVFSNTDTLTVLSQIYAKNNDPATGKPSVASTFAITRDGKPVARADEQTGLMAAVGPVPLKNYPPGKYVVQLKVKDNVAKKEYSQEATFEVK